jgi:hypothetical protein
MGRDPQSYEFSSSLNKKSKSGNAVMEGGGNPTH